MTTIAKYESKTETISNQFLGKLSMFALAWRNYGRYSYDKTGHFTALCAAWQAEFGERLYGPDAAVALCERLAADGMGAFTTV